jgi:ParE toxin of type II toxin-antitoxin system, parDE
VLSRGRTRHATDSAPSSTATEYIVELSAEAQMDLNAVPVFHRVRVLRALAELTHRAEVETRRRKALLAPLAELPEASWEVRVGDYRALYQVTPPGEGPADERTARVLRVILKGRSTMQEALTRAKRR